jgi:hypothetical protein
MITLATLSQATGQQIFDQIVGHLRMQNAKCKSGDSCMYRNPKGLKCAAGCLIADDEYKEIFEHQVFAYVALSLCHLGVHQEALSLISTLQQTHDNKAIMHWERRFKEIAEAYGVTYVEPTPDK